MELIKELHIQEIRYTRREGERHIHAHGCIKEIGLCEQSDCKCKIAA